MMRTLFLTAASFGLLMAANASAQYLPGAVPGQISANGGVGNMLLPSATGVTPQVQYRPRQVTSYARQMINIPQWQYERKTAQAPYTYYVTEYKDVVQRRYRPRVVYDPVDITIKVPQLKAQTATQTYTYTVPKLAFVQQQRVLPQTRTVYDAVTNYQFNYQVDPGAQVLGNQGVIYNSQQAGVLPPPQIVAGQQAAGAMAATGAGSVALPGSPVVF